MYRCSPLKGASAVGVKHDLINRLMMTDPTGTWMDELASNSAGVVASEDSGVNVVPSANSPRPPTPSIEGLDTRSIDILRKEQELAEREIQLLRREVEIMREIQRKSTRNLEGEQSDVDINGDNFLTSNNGVGCNLSSQLKQPRTNISAVADLLSNFDGKSDDYKIWEKQIKLLKTTYKLEDDVARILIGMRLKGKAFQWFHSKPSYITMPFNQLLEELRTMFYHRRSKIETRKKFEERLWKKNETFHEYLHEKIILGNRVPINDDEMLEYIIDGIPDEILQNLARI